ncbi:hypothetical protein [Amycolatopsis magusensis]|uniref:hypothetical protein n=1 Tax=Amycolatopsis magusensis TaxID=882444 RepID=UPI003C2CE5E3
MEDTYLHWSAADGNWHDGQRKDCERLGWYTPGNPDSQTDPGNELVACHLNPMPDEWKNGALVTD